jgi:hypothetical protein
MDIQKCALCEKKLKNPFTIVTYISNISNSILTTANIHQSCKPYFLLKIIRLQIDPFVENICFQAKENNLTTEQYMQNVFHHINTIKFIKVFKKLLCHSFEHWKFEFFKISFNFNVVN